MSYNQDEVLKPLLDYTGAKTKQDLSTVNLTDIEPEDIKPLYIPTAKKQKALDLYRTYEGNRAKVLIEMEIHPRTWNWWIQHDPLFHDAIDLINDYLVGNVEDQVMKKIKEGNDTWMWRYLKNKAPDKWDEKINTTQNQTEPTSFKINIVNTVHSKTKND